MIDNNELMNMSRPTYQVWMAAYVSGELDSEILIMETNVWDIAVVAKLAVNETLKAKYDDRYIAEIRIKGE